MNVEKKCNKCGKCCRGKILGPIIFQKDIGRICKVIGVTPEVFLDEYCENKILNTIHGEILIYFLKVINGACIFLNNKNLCRIFKYRPYQCVYAPFRFLGYYEFWEHMECVKKSDFVGVDTHENDTRMFMQLLNEGYKNVKGGETNGRTSTCTKGD